MSEASEENHDWTWTRVLNRMSDPEAFAAWVWGIYSGQHKGRKILPSVLGTFGLVWGVEERVIWTHSIHRGFITAALLSMLAMQTTHAIAASSELPLAIEQSVDEVVLSQTFRVIAGTPEVVHISGVGADLGVTWAGFQHDSTAFSPNDEWLMLPAGDHTIEITAKYIEPGAKFKVARLPIEAADGNAPDFFRLSRQASRQNLDNPEQRAEALAVYLAAVPIAPSTLYLTLVKLRIADIYRRDSSYAAALRALEFEPLNRLSPRVLIERGSLNSMLGRHAQAVSNFCQALLHLGNTGPCMPMSVAQLHANREIAAAANYLGLVAHITGDLDLATQWYEVVERVNPQGSIRQAALTLNNLGGVSFIRGDTRQAIDRFTTSLRQYEHLDDPHNRWALEGNLALAYIQLGEFDESLQRHLRALDLCRVERWLECEGAQLTLIGNFYYEVGELKQAERYASQAIGVRAQAGLPAPANAYLVLGKSLREQGRLSEAVEQHRIAYESAKNESSLRHQVNAMIELSNNAMLQKKFGAMADYAMQALPYADALGDRGSLGELQRLLGIAARESNDAEKALSHFDQALTLHGPDNHEAIMTRYEWAKALINQRDVEAALEQLNAAANQVEKSRDTIGNAKLRAHFSAQQIEIVDLRVQLLIDAGRTTDALVVVLRNRNRSMLESMLSEDTRAGPVGLRREIRELKRSFAAKREAKTRLAARSAAADEIARIETELSQIALRLDEAESRFMNSVTLDAIDISSLQSTISPTSILLVHVLEQDGGWQWTIRRGSVQLDPLPNVDDVDAMASRLYERIRTRKWKLDDGDGFGRMFFEHVDLTDIEKVFVMGDGSTTSVPYAALPDPTDTSLPLGLRVQFHSLPYLTQSRFDRRSGERKGALIVSDPVYGGNDPRIGGSAPAGTLSRLHHTIKEARAITRLLEDRQYSTENLRGFAATKAALKASQFERYDVLHVATHGIVDYDHLELSGIWLGAVSEQLQPLESLLSVGEIYDMDIDVPLVVLSACDTASGTRIRGEGTMSLSRAFFIAGAQQVVSTNWPVTDQATATFMQAFYASWLESRDSGSAVQFAQQRMMSSDRWANPLYWAGFVAATVERF